MESKVFEKCTKRNEAIMNLPYIQSIIPFNVEMFLTVKMDFHFHTNQCRCALALAAKKKCLFTHQTFWNRYIRMKTNFGTKTQRYSRFYCHAMNEIVFSSEIFSHTNMASPWALAKRFAVLIFFFFFGLVFHKCF